MRDNVKIAADPDRNNDFDYLIRDSPKVSPSALTDLYCPFSAHTRKTVPRNLDPYIQKRYLESGMIVRAGLPYGIEVRTLISTLVLFEFRRSFGFQVTARESRTRQTSSNPAEERGLLFVAYQSSLDQGFVRQTIVFANNDFFPTTSLLPTNHGT